MKSGEFELSDAELRPAIALEKEQSPLLGNHSDSSDHKNLLQTQAGCEKLLCELEGINATGKYRTTNGEITDALLPLRKQAVGTVEDEFKRLKAQSVARGHRIPDAMPREMRERYIKTLALLRVAELEVEYVHLRIKKFQEEMESESAARVLCYGPRGIGRIAPTSGYPKGRLIEIDGQTVEPDAEGLMRICDLRSPYNGMKCCDYIDSIVKVWSHERSRTYEKQMEDLRQEQREHPGLRLPEPPLPKIEKINRDSLPPWPSCVPRPKAKQKEGKDAK